MRASTVNVTVGIATCDRPFGLACCLDALLTGQVLPAEVIVVNQGQGSAVERIVDERNGILPIVHIQQPRLGLSVSRNAAVVNAHSPIVAVTDDDCVPDSGWIQAIERALEAPDAPAAVTGRILPLGSEQPGLYVVSPRESTVRTRFSGKVLPWIVGSGANFAVNREWLERVGLYDEGLGTGSGGRAAEDCDLLYRLLAVGGSVLYEPGAVIYHERQPRDRRIASRWSYGYGMGAFCSKWLRRRDLYALHTLAAWFRWQGRELWWACWRRQKVPAYERMLSLGGTLAGLLYGLYYRPAERESWCRS